MSENTEIEGTLLFKSRAHLCFARVLVRTKREKNIGDCNFVGAGSHKIGKILSF